MGIGLIVIVVVAAGTLLTGCSNQSQEEEFSEEEIKETIYEEEEVDDTLVVEGAIVACTSMLEDKSTSRMIKQGGGENNQGGKALNYKDIDFKPIFTGCKYSENQMCQKEIENDEWQDYDDETIDGKGVVLKEQSFMFCLCGFGIIYATDDGQRIPDLELKLLEGKIDIVVTLDMMNKFRWASLTDKDILTINMMLIRYNITDAQSIRLFLATCGHESGKGLSMLELLNSDGSTVGRYFPEQRGAGYIQITWRDTHLEFLKSVGDGFNGEDTATYIAQNYPWEAAGWFWSSTKAKKAGKVSLNEYVAKYGDSEGVYFVTQCFVNGWPDGLSQDTAVAIRDGKVSWEVKNGKLYVDGKKICNEPRGWQDREDNYNDAHKNFK